MSMVATMAEFYRFVKQPDKQVRLDWGGYVARRIHRPRQHGRADRGELCQEAHSIGGFNLVEAAKTAPPPPASRRSCATCACARFSMVETVKDRPSAWIMSSLSRPTPRDGAPPG